MQSAMVENPIEISFDRLQIIFERLVHLGSILIPRFRLFQIRSYLRAVRWRFAEAPNGRADQTFETLVQWILESVRIDCLTLFCALICSEVDVLDTVLWFKTHDWYQINYYNC